MSYVFVTVNVGGTTEEDDTSVDKHIEAASEPSSDDVRSLPSNNTRQADASTQTDEETMELYDIHACDQTMNTIDSAEAEENAKSLPHVSTSELEEYREYQDSNSQVVQVSVSLKKNDSNYESSDGNTVSDVEGENIVDQLKRQIEHDRNCMNSLYKELEEERNAAAIAANQAMAMITRLQEEKAALHMEALQYLRMMEEQAEYDMEALERANDLLAEKEKELQDLEFELEFYRNNFLDGSGVHKIQKETSVVDNRVESSPPDSSNSKAAKFSKANGNCKPMNGSVLDFEDEKMYISQCLKTDDHLAFEVLETSIHARICDSIST